MNIDPDKMEAGPEMDRAVAESVGFDLDDCGQWRGPDGFSKDSAFWSPSTDWNDAMLAAEKAFSPSENGLSNGYAINFRDGAWTAGPKYQDYDFGWDWVNDCEADAHTGPLAICRAILKTKANA